MSEAQTMNEGKSREEEGGRRQRFAAQLSPSNRSLDLGGSGGIIFPNSNFPNLALLTGVVFLFPSISIPKISKVNLKRVVIGHGEHV